MINLVLGQVSTHEYQGLRVSLSVRGELKVSLNVNGAWVSIWKLVRLSQRGKAPGAAHVSNPLR